MRIQKIAAAFAVAVAFSNARAQRSNNIADWRGDLAVIAKRLPEIHPNAFYRLKKSSWDSAVTSLDQRLPSMSRNQAMVAFAQLVAMVNDGHTSINPLFDTAMSVHYYPVRFQQFEDGLFIRSAAPAYKSIVGGKVIRVGSMSADDAVRVMATTLSHENEWWVKAWAPIRLNLAEFDEGLGITTKASQLPIVIEKDGKQQSVTLDMAGRIMPGPHNPLGGYDMRNWVDMHPVADEPLWLENPDKLYWAQFIDRDSTLYVSYRAVVSLAEEPNTVFWKKVFAISDSLPVKRLVIDVRENGGGNSFFNKQVVRGIIARPRLDKAGSLFVIVGSRTFSAAMNLVQDLEQWTNATLVGEPTGNATTFFGDHTQIVLPASGITVNVSTLPWYPADPNDKRQFIAPRLYTPLTSTEYRANVDPAMAAIAKLGSEPTLSDKVQAALEKNDSSSAVNLITAASHDPINRFRSPEQDINALGYRLLPTNRDLALSVFRTNTIAFPKSPNTWDSYGEALLASGQREAAISAYRHALALDSDFASSRRALVALGVTQAPP